MTSPTLSRDSRGDASHVVIAVTDDGADPRYAPVRAAAARLAAEARGSVVLFHAPPGPLPLRGRPRLFVPPAMPVDGGDARPHTGSRVRDLLGPEAAAIRAAAVEVAVWLATGCGPAAIAEAAKATRAAVVLVPTGAERCGDLRGRVDRTLAYYAGRIPVPLLAVDDSGRIQAVAPLGRAADPDSGRLGVLDRSARPSGAVSVPATPFR